MDQKIHRFDDDLGGRYRYNDEPGRLTWLLGQDKKARRKSKRSPNRGQADMRVQAHWYAQKVMSNNETELLFWPLKKNMTAAPNQFRFMVLKELGMKAPYFGTDSRKLECMQEQAIRQGYTIREYSDE